MLIFEYEKQSENKVGQIGPEVSEDTQEITMPNRFLRKTSADLPSLSELTVVRHFSQLSQKNISIDTHPYFLGSCTMKYNPKLGSFYTRLPGFAQRHPYASEQNSQGILQSLYELQDMLAEITGMQAVALSPMGGAQGEFVGVAMIQAYHQDNNDFERCEILVPDSAHGTNPASAVMCGYTVKEIPTKADGNLDLKALEQALSHKTAGIMLTNPSTLGLFEEEIQKASKIVHEAGGLLYYDGANLNAILGRVRPGDMGFDVLHLNLHKTFSTPHGGGGPGCGPVACNARLAKYLPVPIVGKKNQNTYFWQTKQDCPNSIGRVSSFAGNINVMLQAYIYLRVLGKEGLRRVSEYAVLNANYLMKMLGDIGLHIAYPDRKACHEFLITFQPELKRFGISARDIAKRLLDFGFHAPTTYFPLLVPECWLIEPTETESKQTLDKFVEVMAIIMKEIEQESEKVKTAPHTYSVKRLDEVKAAKELDVVFE